MKNYRIHFAEREREAANSVAEFMIDVFRRANPNERRGAEVTVRDALDAAASRIDRDLINQPRLRLSLIPLFLERPEFSVHVRAVARKLDPPARLTLQCYYSAAVWLAQKYQPDEARLPDHFSKVLHLNPTTDPDENLRALAKRHRELSGTWVNWLGTYQHAAQVWQKGLEYR